MNSTEEGCDIDACVLDAFLADVTAALAPYYTAQGLAFPIANHLAMATT